MSIHPPTQIYSSPPPQTALSGPLPTSSHRPESHLLEGLDNVGVQLYNGLNFLARELRVQADALLVGGSDQFAVFCPVTPSQFLALDRKRQLIRKYPRIIYSEKEQTIIIKLMPAAGLEAAYTTFITKLVYSMALMGIPDSALVGMGSTRF